MAWIWHFLVLLPGSLINTLSYKFSSVVMPTMIYVPLILTAAFLAYSFANSRSEFLVVACDVDHISLSVIISSSKAPIA